MTIRSRLDKLARAQAQSTAAPVACIVILDATGKPITPVNKAAQAFVYLPDNGRGDRS